MVYSGGLGLSLSATGEIEVKDCPYGEKDDAADDGPDPKVVEMKG